MPDPERAHTRAGDDDPTRIGPGSFAATRDPAENILGTSIGPYKILQEIGEGGFGSVFMAQQAEPIRRKVALKLIKPGMDTRQVVGRFEAERQALAMMDHPNIARVLDAGTTPQGRPFFVMELVRGEPITAYCDANNLTTEQRIELFIPVCHAVLHAHQKGIVHRDLKPSNILVTLHDGTPVPKVIDFGIAKAMGQQLTDKTVFTGYKQFIGTPQYMSPEQAAMSGLDVDTRADIYSLGVVLYELLTGTTPFDAGRLREADLAEIQRIIRDEEPPKPSTRVAKDSAHRTGAKTAHALPTSKAEEVARHRRTDPGSLRRALRGDLDWIVLRAMEKDRTRRYPTAGAFAEDLRRVLANEPIAARAPTAAYRLRKFTRRNRPVIAMAAAALAGLLVALGALGFGLRQAQYERDHTAERETVARAELLLTTMNAVRSYTSERVRPAMLRATGNPSLFAPECVPGYSARAVFDFFKRNPAAGSFAYKEASDNPTNISNRADPFEAELLERFRADRERKELTGVRESPAGRQFYLARPLGVYDNKCLDCHTTPETAPPEQVAQYGRESGYGWKHGDIVAAQVVYVPVTEAFRADPARSTRVLLILSGVFVLLVLIVIVAVRRA